MALVELVVAREKRQKNNRERPRTGNGHKGWPAGTDVGTEVGEAVAGFLDGAGLVLLLGGGLVLLALRPIVIVPFGSIIFSSVLRTKPKRTLLH